MIMTETAK
jgi:magnesium-transporting ATPase (P-type)